MQGINLVVHAIKILFYDIWTTVRLTVFPMVIGFGVAFFVLFFLGGDFFIAAISGTIGPSTVPTGSFFLAAFLAIVVMTIVFCWAAISWHRFVLLEERPGALLPKMDRSSLGSYFWEGLKLALVSSCFLIPAGFLFWFLLQALGSAVLYVNPVISIIISALIMRFYLILPAVAIGNPMLLEESWDATSGQFVTFLVVAVLLAVIGFFTSPGLVPGYVGWVVTIFFSWLSFALGISILTTLYGVYIEGREF
jgi:hypothetical protein